jgi:hypothetical protein
MRKFLFMVILGALFLISHEDAVAQCAMCKATIEANSTNSGKYGVGLNTGILYLMSVPYIAAMIIGYFWYRNAKKSGKLPGTRKMPRAGFE